MSQDKNKNGWEEDYEIGLLMGSLWLSGSREDFLIFSPPSIYYYFFYFPRSESDHPFQSFKNLRVENIISLTIA
jgi:hypothetical protein